MVTGVTGVTRGGAPGTTDRGVTMTVTELRRWIVDGARGVLMGAAACDLEGTMTECRQIWDLGRDGEDTGERAAEPAGVHVIGTTR